MEKELLQLLLEFQKEAIAHPMTIESKTMEERFTLATFIEWLRSRDRN